MCLTVVLLSFLAAHLTTFIFSMYCNLLSNIRSILKLSTAICRKVPKNEPNHSLVVTEKKKELHFQSFMHTMFPSWCLLRLIFVLNLNALISTQDQLCSGGGKLGHCIGLFPIEQKFSGTSNGKRTRNDIHKRHPELAASLILAALEKPV